MSENQTPIQKVRQVLAAGPVLEAEATPQQMRDGMNSLLGAAPVPAEAQITAAELGGVPGEWVEMPGAEAQRAVLYLHGGGYVLGSPQTHHALTTKLAQSAGARLFSLDYRLAPEHPFPAAVEDAAAAYRALLDAGFDGSQIAVSGDSAGGGLTVALLLKLRDEGTPLPAAAAPISPWVDLTGDAETLTTLAGRDPIVQREGLLRLAGWYLNGADPRTPLASPLFANLSGLPPLLIQVGSDETLLDDSRNLQKNAEAAGVQSKLEVWDDMIHVWHAFHFMLPEGAAALETIGDFFKEHWDNAPSPAKTPGSEHAPPPMTASRSAPELCDIGNLLPHAFEFRKTLEKTRAEIETDPEFIWHPQDTLSNFWHFDSLLVDEQRDLAAMIDGRRIADVGAGDGDLSFFLSSLGVGCDAYENAHVHLSQLSALHKLQEHFGSDVTVTDLDLDKALELPRGGYGLIFFLGVLYHLKNPLGVLEGLSRQADYCLLSTRVARFGNDRKHPMSPLPVAYLLDPNECNNDPSNFWIFSPECLLRMVDRAGWDVCSRLHAGNLNRSDPSTADGDERVFLLLRSRATR